MSEFFCQSTAERAEFLQRLQRAEAEAEAWLAQADTHTVERRFCDSTDEEELGHQLQVGAQHANIGRTQFGTGMCSTSLSSSSIVDPASWTRLQKLEMLISVLRAMPRREPPAPAPHVRQDMQVRVLPDPSDATVALASNPLPLGVWPHRQPKKHTPKAQRIKNMPLSSACVPENLAHENSLGGDSTRQKDWPMRCPHMSTGSAEMGLLVGDRDFWQVSNFAVDDYAPVNTVDKSACMGLGLLGDREVWPASDSDSDKRSTFSGSKSSEDVKSQSSMEPMYVHVNIEPVQVCVDKARGSLMVWSV
eukprot:gnl/TRDRNA2_/TRDRNA2_177521_c0_seq2.p1 gnl/TRDRNA2_/TRDRNA2_177521_c0~~gnl/TRDRNA2_/TRDRNA2_177521_c0_seq2.p1  ORF type:complete len:305 (-),score=41.70 gnl/TRDRNA2_/TRDRNA2_177521_c0_seq2:217-1131(-)